MRRTNDGRIVDKDRIRMALDAHMLHPDRQRAPWIVAVHSREHMPAGWTYEGCCVVSAFETPDGERTYSFSIDGNLMPQLKLSLIDYVITL